jgi:hypothetical protein
MIEADPRIKFAAEDLQGDWIPLARALDKAGTDEAEAARSLTSQLATGQLTMVGLFRERQPWFETNSVYYLLPQKFWSNAKVLPGGRVVGQYNFLMPTYFGLQAVTYFVKNATAGEIRQLLARAKPQAKPRRTTKTNTKARAKAKAKTPKRKPGRPSLLTQQQTKQAQSELRDELETHLTLATMKQAAALAHLKTKLDFDC